MNEVIDLEEYRRDYDLYMAQLADRPTAEQEQRPNFEAVEAVLTQDYRAIYDTLDRSEKRTLCRSIIKEIHINRNLEITRVVFYRLLCSKLTLPLHIIIIWRIKQVNCKKCGKEIPPDGVFCPYCGTRQIPKPSRKRRGNGSGYAYQRGKTWTLRVTLGWTIDEQGRTVRLCRTKGGFPTKAEALRHVEELKGEQVRKAPTLAQLWAVYLSGPFTKLSTSKQTAYKIAWGKLAQISTRTVDKLTIKELSECVAAKAPTYYPARDMKTVLSKLWDYAIAEQYVSVRLPDFIELPALHESEPEPFSEIEIHALWNGYGSGDRFAGYILLMIYSGMMPGELLDLRLGMINWERNEIIGAGKKTTERKKTPLVLADIIVPVLDDLCQHSQTRKDKVVGMNKDKFYDEYYKCLERNHCRRLTPYACRHTTATALALGNIAPSVIQKVMRHAKFTTTQRYIHPDTVAMREAVNSIQLSNSGTKTGEVAG